MNVQELIDNLQEVEDKEKEVVFTSTDGYIVVEIASICTWSNAIVLSSSDDY